MLRNPQPDKIVDTIDLKSADAPLASYKLIAATRHPKRSEAGGDAGVAGPPAA
jgi:hypothetical protein